MDAARDGARRPPRDLVRAVPAAAVLLVVAVGLAAVALSRWRAGCTVVGLGLLLGGGLRLVLSDAAAGALVVRRKGLDAAVLLALGAGVVVLAGSVPAAD